MTISFSLIISYLYLTFGIFVFLLGLTILRVGGNSPSVRSTALVLFFCGVGPILSASNVIMMNSLREGSVVYTSMVENFQYLWEFYFPSLFLFSLTFPKENRFIKKYGFLAFMAFMPHIVHLITLMIAGSSPDLTSRIQGGILNADIAGGKGKLAFSGLGNLVSVLLSLLLRAHKQLFSLVNIGFATLAVAFLFKSLRSLLSPSVKGQLRTVLLGIVVSLLTYVSTKFIPVVMGQSLPGDANMVLINFSLLAGGASISYAVIRQRFLGIRFVLRKSIIYGAVALLFALLYFIVVKPIGTFFGQYSIRSQEAFETAFIIMTILAFQPALTRFEEILESFLLGSRDDKRVMFKTLGAELMSSTSMEELETRLKNELKRILDVGEADFMLVNGVDSCRPLATLLGEIGDPVSAQDLLKLSKESQAWQDGESSRLGADGAAGGEFDDAAAELLGRYSLFVPVKRDRECIGVVTLGEKNYGTRFSAEELSLLSILSNELGAAIENIRLLRESVEKQVIEEELRLARSIQVKLLPTSAPVIEDYDLFAVTKPSRYVGGDYFDYELLDERTLAIAMADVSGKGVPASILVATLHAAIRSNEDVRCNPSEMVKRVNRLLFRSTSPEQFATLFYGVVDLNSGLVRYTNAGHDFPMVLGAREMKRLENSGIVLGCVGDFEYEECSCLIPHNGMLVLYTDGVTEVVSEEAGFFGEKKLQEILLQHSSEGAERICQKVLDEVTSFSSNGEPMDDLTLLVLKRTKEGDRSEEAHSGNRSW